MRVSLPWLRDNLRLPETGSTVARLLTEHSFETTVASSAGAGLLDVDVLPNRAADCLSHLGLARELGALLGRRVFWPRLTLPKVRAQKLPFALRVVSPKLCPRFLAILIEGVHGGAISPLWMQRRLQAVGVRPQNLIVDITNYVLWEVGQPTHAFDARAIRRTLGVRKSRGGEKLRTLDGVERTLPPDVLVLTSADEPIDVAGIIGGVGTGVASDTTAIVLTSALFDRTAIRKASQVLHLRTDASDRFSKGRTAAHVEAGAARVVQLLQEYGGGKVRGVQDVYPRKAETRVVRVRPDEVNALLGLRVPVARQKKILVSLGCEVTHFAAASRAKSGVGERFSVRPPLFRTDLAIPEDIAEEVGRMMGLGKIPRVAPRAPLRPAALPEDALLLRKLQDELKAAGWTETLSYSFSAEEETIALGLDSLEHLTVVNPLNRDQRRLRVSLLPNLTHQAWAAAKKIPMFRLFELGRVYLPGNNAQERPKAGRSRLSTVALAKVDDQGWRAREPLRLTGLLLRRGEVPDDQRQHDFYEVKGLTEHLLTLIGLRDIGFAVFEPRPDDPFHSLWAHGQGARVKVGTRTEIGFVGVVAQGVLERIGVAGTIVAFDLDLSVALALEKSSLAYEAPLPYPTVVRDLTLLVPHGVLVDTLMEAIDQAGAPLVQNVNFLDLYEGENLPEGRRSVTFRITYGSRERTLRDAEVNTLQQRMTAHLEETFGVEVRS